MSCSKEKPEENNNEKKTVKENGDSVFQRFVIRAKMIRKSTPNSQSQRVLGQSRPGLLMTLFGNPIQKFRRQQQHQKLSTGLMRQASFAVVKVEEGQNFEVCHEFNPSPTVTVAQASTSTGNGSTKSNIYRPPRLYHQRSVVTSTHPDTTMESGKHVLKSEIRVIASAPIKQHKALSRQPGTPVKPLHKYSTGALPPSVRNGSVNRKISAPAGTPPPKPPHTMISKKFSTMENGAVVGKKVSAVME